MPVIEFNQPGIEPENPFEPEPQPGQPSPEIENPPLPRPGVPVPEIGNPQITRPEPAPTPGLPNQPWIPGPG